MSITDGPSLVSAESLENFRSYLLAVAGQRLGPELRAKVGASDVVQDTLLAAQLGRKAFRGEDAADLKPWLRGILLHRLANLRRKYLDTAKTRIGAEVPLATLPTQGSAWKALADTATSACTAAVRGELRDTLEEGLARLPDHYRRVLELRYREGLTFEAIAARLEISADASRKLWGRAVLRLRETMGPGHDPG